MQVYLPHKGLTVARRALTPKRHEGCEEDRRGVVKQVHGLVVVADVAQLPIGAKAVAGGTHAHVLRAVTDLLAAEKTHFLQEPLQQALNFWTVFFIAQASR